MSIQIVTLFLALITFSSSCILFFAAYRLWPEKRSTYGSMLVAAMIYKGLFWLAISGLMLYGATAGKIVVTLHPVFSVITLVLYLLMHAAIDHIALVVAGTIKAKE